MERKAPKFDRYFLTSRTDMASRRVAETIKLAKVIEDDSDKERRIQRQKCKACHYFTAMGGAAMTEQPCACCGAPEMYGSTNTDALCLSCAKEHTLCKHCGGDLEMRKARKDWPKTTN